MSPSWREHWRVAMTPDALVVARFGRGLRPRLADGRVEPLKPPAPGAPAWQPAVEALAQVLAEKARGARLTVILSNHFVRYLLVPWHDELTGPDERLALARHAFAQVYGDAAGAWTLRLAEGPWGGAAPAAAVDSGLLQAIEDAAQKAHVQLASVQPYWMAAVNQFRAELASTGCFALVEPGKLCIGVYRNQSWQELAARRVSPGADLAGLLTQELLGFDGAPTDRVLLHGAEEDLPLPGGARRLELPAPAARRELCMALCGAAG